MGEPGGRTVTLPATPPTGETAPAPIAGGHPLADAPIDCHPAVGSPARGIPVADSAPSAGAPTTAPAGTRPPSTGPTPVVPSDEAPTLLSPARDGGRTRSAHRGGVGWWHPPKARPRGDGARHRVPEDERSSRTTRRRRIRLALLGFAATALLGPVLAFAVGYVLFPVPTPDDVVNNQVALLSYADGDPLTRLVPEQGNRTKVPIQSVPAHVREAVLAAEDRSFYSNPGFDPIGIARAAWNQVRGGDGGGSTITQQYVKNTLVGDAPSLWRKYKELIVSVKVSQENTKDQILGDYLNAIYFGRGAYGIQAASQAYFGKNVQDLTVAEGAVLAGVIQSPSRWDPAVNPDRAVTRWNFVLDGMVAQRWLTPAERSAQRFPTAVPRTPQRGGVPAGADGHIVSAVIAELADLGITEQDVAQEGLRITTTIDPVRQKQAVKAVRDALAGQPDNLRSALVAIDPQTGGVLAYYGGENGLGLDYARVERLAGSTFKPFAVLAALQESPPVGLGTMFAGESVPGLRNDEGASCTHCDLKQAMTLSNNVVFNSLAKQVGGQAVADAARSAGITTPLDDPDERIALGNKEITAVDLASAYATIAAGGVWHQPHLVASVVTTDGRVLYQSATDGERRFSDRVARNVTESMLDVAPHDDLALPGGRPVAAKTGTVQSHVAGQNNDAWMAGFTPSVAAAVWLGTDRNEPIRTASGRPISGKDLPGDAWHDFMTDATAGRPTQEFAPFRAIGAPPSDLPPDVDPRKPPVTATAQASAAPLPSEQPVAPTAALPTEPPVDERSACTLAAPCG
ncbi:MAG TPA: transglycosylase domain-containing protein [Pseudonocardia sp.]|nr:transglycosylase domain-containing protein [Pseudonocardia sp.]